MNKFTIITINYNNKVGLQKTIKSVFDRLLEITNTLLLTVALRMAAKR